MPIEFKCELCDKTYKSSTGLNYHKQVHNRQSLSSAGLPKLVTDLEDVSKMLSDIVSQLKRFSRIDLSGLAMLLGGNSPIQATPKESNRSLTKQEKDQIRLLWSQSNKDKSIQLPRLAQIYHTNPYHISRILFNKFSPKPLE